MITISPVILSLFLHAFRKAVRILHKLTRFLLSRTFLICMLALGQVCVFAWLFLFFTRAGTVAYTLLTIVSVLAVVIVFECDDINPAYKIMWMLIVVAMPVTGAVFYLWWGKRGVTKKKAAILDRIEKNATAAMVQDDLLPEKLRAQDPTLARCAEYLSRNASAPLFANTQSEYFPIGEDFFARFLESIENAQRSIFMEYFSIE